MTISRIINRRCSLLPVHVVSPTVEEKGTQINTEKDGLINGFHDSVQSHIKLVLIFEIYVSFNFVFW